MISAVITATNKFGDYATDLIADIKKHEPRVEIILIDNASNPPYQFKGVRIIRNEAQHNWANMLNSGAKAARGDWLIILNDDVRCHAPFARRMETLDKRTLYGPQIRQKPPSWVGKRILYIYAWMLIIHRDTFWNIGGLDENYPAAGVDDIDFAWTAQQNGYRLKVLSLPFKHLADQPGFVHRRTKWDDVDFVKRMEASRSYLEAKVNK